MKRLNQSEILLLGKRKSGASERSFQCNGGICDFRSSYDKGFCQKGSCSETQLWWIKERNLSVGADITGTRNKIGQIVSHCSI